ncbi:MAG TPA: hypothetical protein VF585_08040 [Chthoniobacterales bacterium]|jgi:hypothetical protein
MIATRRKRIIIALGILLAFGGIVAWQWDSILRAYFFHRIRAVTTALPHCDRVELSHLRGGDTVSAPVKPPTNAFSVRPYGSYPTVLSRQTLSGMEAESFAALWRAQTYGPHFTGLCHYPVYGLRFYSGNELRFETTLCFDCSNFYINLHGGGGCTGFDTSTPKARELFLILQQAFPASVRKPK